MENWHCDNWRGGWPSGPAVVFDLDGVLSDAASRQHYLEGPWRDWDAFFEACGDDPLIEEIARLLGLLDPSLAIVLLTARPAWVQPQTLAWLHRYRLRWDLLVMRDFGDYGAAREFKRRSVRELRGRGLRAGAVVRGRPSQRGHVPRRGRAVGLHPFRLLRLRHPAR